jgi:GAF domain-containing protein
MNNKYEAIVSTVTQSVNQSINLQDILETTVEAMSKNIEGADFISIYLVEGQEAVLKANKGHPDRFIERAGRIPYPKGLTWKTITEGKPISCVDTDQDTAIGPAGREMGIKSYLSISIRLENKAVGTLTIASSRKNAFSEEELKLLETLAQHIEIAINKAQKK